MAFSAEPDFSKPPTANSIEEYLEKGFSESSKDLRQALLAAYKPSRGAIVGSSSNPAFRAWMRLALWFELMASSDRDQLSKFLSRYLGRREKDGQVERLYRTSGVPFSADVVAAPQEEILEIVSNPGTRETYAARFLAEHHKWLDAACEDYLGKELAAKWSLDTVFLEEFFNSLSPADYPPAVLANLAELHASNPEKFQEYRSLAIALALVFDELPPKEWPHFQVLSESVPRETASLKDRFDFWVRSNETGKLLLDLRKLGADQLKFVVDSLAPMEELEWAQRNVRTARPTFGRVFSSIRYDHPRLKQQQYDWPHPGTYSLEAISEKGGLCIDQAYFAMLSGKARGLPTLFFVGQGVDGGHAWFGYLKGDNRWDLDCGRYENQNYAVGQALDPQSWEPITDHELLFLSQRVRRTPPFEAGRADLIVSDWFAHEAKPQEAFLAAESAMKTSPSNPEAWKKSAEFLAASGAETGQQIKLLQSAAAHFSTSRDLKMEFELASAKVSRDSGDETSASQIEQKLISQNTRLRSDLSVGIAAEKLSALVDSGDLESAMQEYRAMAVRLGRTGGGNFYYEISYPLIQKLVAKDHKREALRVIDLTRRTLRPDRDSILDQELTGWEDRLSK